ncbi:MAG: site-specific integrase [Mesorhizobium sp.]|uniref:tyrosine-type recombinase/integrase n=1 Tax=Mesorhizobium sp. TaxID=1871066 RepID=UPI000FE4DC3E|nr:site-specific integrase [Mesorhizobium sp.]RWA76660.1 MAG: site-specific integrase [Mesorhizobium sp.]RWC05080.1 MAG: site-specific integrase [Mesorhizobium sp.]
MAKALTGAALTKLKADPNKRLEIPDAVLPGLFLIIQPTGRKAWALRYRHKGKPRKLTLGNYLAGADEKKAGEELKKVRREAGDILESVRAGADPAAEKQETRKAAKAEAEDQSLLFKNVAADFIDKYHRHKKKNRYADWVETLFANHVTPKWGEKHISEITDTDVRHLINKIDAAGKHVMANRVFTALSTFFDWCAKPKNGIPVTSSPMDGMEKSYDETPRERVLTDDEIRWFWKAATKHGQPFGHMFKVLLLTGQRRTEAAAMTTKEIDGADWVIPGSRTKNGRDNVVPISTAVQDVLDDVKRLKTKAGYIFSTTGETYATGWSRATKAIAKSMLEMAREETKDPEFSIDHWTLHDLRRTAASGMARLRIRPHVIEAVLNHSSGIIRGIAAIYNRYDYYEEKQAALDAWGRYVDELVTGKPADNVIPMARA